MRSVKQNEKKRRRERAWRKSKLEVHRQCFHEQCQLVNSMLLDVRPISTQIRFRRLEMIRRNCLLQRTRFFTSKMKRSFLCMFHPSNLQNGFQASSKRGSCTFDANCLLRRHGGIVFSTLTTSNYTSLTTPLSPKN